MNVDVLELLDLDEGIIVDIRNSYYYEIGHIEGAINIPYYNLLNNYSHYLNKDDVYYLYCDTGEKSYDLVKYLEKLGYVVFNINGGYLSYCKVKKKA